MLLCVYTLTQYINSIKFPWKHAILDKGWFYTKLTYARGQSFVTPPTLYLIHIYIYTKKYISRHKIIEYNWEKNTGIFGYEMKQFSILFCMNDIIQTCMFTSDAIQWSQSFNNRKKWWKMNLSLNIWVSVDDSETNRFYSKIICGYS